MSSFKTKLSNIKWSLIDLFLVYPIKKIFEFIYKPIMVRVLQSINSVGKIDFKEKDIFINVKSVSELSRLNSCKKEPSTIEWLCRDLRDGDVLFDIGSNVGAYSLVAASVTNNNFLCYAFEPSPTTFASLCMNISLNSQNEKIIPLQIALSLETGISRFFLSSKVSGAAEHALGSPIDMFGNTFEPVDIQTVLSLKMDDLESYFGIKNPSHIKIDVDGIELLILKGGEKILKSEKLRHLLIEVNEESDECKSTVEFLNSIGFKFTKKGYVTTPGFANYEFEKK